jgi:hypothetical protein
LVLSYEHGELATERACVLLPLEPDQRAEREATMGEVCNLVYVLLDAHASLGSDAPSLVLPGFGLALEGWPTLARSMGMRRPCSGCARRMAAV